jgi:hypothetical protein
MHISITCVKDMVINFNIYIRKKSTKYYAYLQNSIVNYSYSYADSLFVNMFYIRNSWYWKDIFHLIFDRILYVIERKGYLSTT